MTFQGTLYREDDLRDWATFGITEEYTLEDIARAIQEGGWLLYEGIWPSKNDMDKSTMERISEAFQGDLEVHADETAEALPSMSMREQRSQKSAPIKL